MDTVLSAEVSRLVPHGWHVRSQTETTASLDTRTPFNWLWFALAILLFFGFGGLLYVTFWLIVSHAHLFLHVENGLVISSGDTWLVERQRENDVEARRLAIAIKQQGFWRVMWPAFVSTLLVLVLWIVLIRVVVVITR
jgi:hypothetical protein